MPEDSQTDVPISKTRVASVIVCLVLLALTCTTLAGVLAPKHWGVDLLANLRVQQVIALLAALVIGFLNRQKWAAACLVVLLMFHMPWFRAAWPENPQADDSAQPAFKVKFSNVLTQNQRHQDVVSDLVSGDPDVIVIAELGSQLAVKLDVDLAKDYPYRVLHPQDRGNFGIGVLSKTELKDAESILSGPYDIESIAATFTVQQHDVRVFATHPLPPMGPENHLYRNAQLDAIADRIQTCRNQNPDQAVVLVGDLNLTPWSPVFRRLEQTSGLRRAGSGFSMQPTWYRYAVFPFGLMLDHALISNDLRCLTHEVGPEAGSDHRAVTVQLAPVSN